MNQLHFFKNFRCLKLQTNFLLLYRNKMYERFNFHKICRIAIDLDKFFFFICIVAVRISLFINSKLETNYIWFKSQIEFLFELPKLDYEGGGHKLKSFFLFGEKIKLHDIAQIKTQSHLFASSIWYEKHNNGSIMKLWL